MNANPTLPKDFLNRLKKRLQFIYKETYTDHTLAKIAQIICSYKIMKNDRDEKWDENDAILITYGDSIKTKLEKPLQTLKSFLDEKLKEETTCVHILPFFPYSSDDGFSVIDFREVNPELGDWEDVKAICRNFDLMADLVVNHASRKSEWFNNLLKNEGKGKDYFIVVNPDTDLSDVVRPRNSPLLTPYETAEEIKHIWTTFSADQVDLNFKNPELLSEMIDILLQYAENGARIIRLDAIAFLWKEIGTSCLHLPETHEVVKLFRDILEYINPGIIVLTETNVPNKENLSYFGNGDEAHMVYQFSLPPLLLHALHSGNSKFLNQWSSDLPDPGKGCTYFNFTASHDGIGVRPLEGLLPDNEKAQLYENMISQGGLINMKANKDGSSSPYELNITYFDALKGTKDGIDDKQEERFIASQTVMMSFKGVPAFYIHSLTATPNYHKGVAATNHNRFINRRKWDKDELEELLNSTTPNSRVFNELKRRITIRKQQKAFHPDAEQKILDLGKEVFALHRKSIYNNQKIFIIANLSDKGQKFSEFQGKTVLLTGNITQGELKL